MTGHPPPADLLVVTGIEGAPLRYRGHALAQAHRALGGQARVLHHRHREIPAVAAGAGLVVFYRVPWSSWVRDCIEAARAAGASVVFSVDDLVFDPALRDRIPAVRSLPATEAEQWMEGVRRYQATARACGTVVASTPAIARAAEAQGLHSLVVGNTLSREVALLSQAAVWDSRKDRAQRQAEGTCRIGYLSGTTTHDADWALVEPAISQLLDTRPKVELWLLGPVRPGSALSGHPRVRTLGFRPFQELPRLQTELDVVVAPLEDLEFSEAKSAIKWMEAAAVAVPTVASPTEPFRQVIDDGVTGLLAAGDDWHNRLATLVDDPDARRRVGRAARAAVYAGHGPAAAARAWAEAWPRLLELGTAALSLPGAGPVEQPSVPALEPEAPDGYLDTSPTGALRPGPRLGGSATTTLQFAPRYPALCRVDIETSTFGAPAAAPIELVLRRDGEVLVEGLLEAGTITDDGWTAWSFDPLDCAGQQLELTVRQPGARDRSGIACWLDAGGRPNARTWGRPSRGVISAVAAGRGPDVATEAPRQPGRALVLWHKGRHSLQSQGFGPTYRRVSRYLARWWRGRQAARGGPGR